MVSCKWRKRERSSKRALLIGIEYDGQDKLKGTIRDIRRFSWILRSYYSFANEELLVLTDSDNTGINHVEHRPATKRSIDGCLRLFVDNLRSGDTLVLFFAGHGGQKIAIPGVDGSIESDGLNEYILPSDHRMAGHIDDDKLHDRVVKHIPKGVTLSAIMDCCHSGTLLDLPYIFDPNNKGSGIISLFDSTSSLSADIQESMETAKKKFMKNDPRGAAKSVIGILSRTAQEKFFGAKEHEEIHGLVFLLSAGKDEERALTKTEDGFFCGALTDALIKILMASETKTVSIGHVITQLRTDLAKQNQTPQISCSRLFAMSDVFLSGEKGKTN